jgi:hypothetical protein
LKAQTTHVVVDFTSGPRAMLADVIDKFDSSDLVTWKARGISLTVTCVYLKVYQHSVLQHTPPKQYLPAMSDPKFKNN